MAKIFMGDEIPDNEIFDKDEDRVYALEIGTKRSISKMMKTRLRRFLVDCYKDPREILTLGSFRPEDEIMINIAQNESAQQIIDNIFTFTMFTLANEHDMRNFKLYSDVKEEYLSTLQMTQTLLSWENARDKNGRGGFVSRENDFNVVVTIEEQSK